MLLLHNGRSNELVCVSRQAIHKLAVHWSLFSLAEASTWQENGMAWLLFLLFTCTFHKWVDSNRAFTSFCLKFALLCFILSCWRLHHSFFWRDEFLFQAYIYGCVLSFLTLQLFSCSFFMILPLSSCVMYRDTDSKWTSCMRFFLR